MKKKSKALIKLLGAIISMVFSFLILYGRFINGDSLGNYGLLGVFLAALFSHLTIVARGLFIPIFLPLTEIYNPIILGLTAGLGGAFGEIVAYYWGSSIKEIFNSSERNKASSYKRIEKYGLLMALIFASSPLPDTPIMLLAGSLHLPLWKLILIQIIGKTTLYSVGAIVGSIIFMELKSAVEEIIISTIILFASIALCIIVSWSKSRDMLLKILDKIMGKFRLKSIYI
ncbi:MAG: hypothetical protein QXX94_06015 [Candidatus Bathyarchaeia archaeon]